MSSVLFVVTRSDELGGAQVHVRDLAQGLLLRGWQVDVAAGGKGVLAKQLSERKVSYRALRHMVRPFNPLRDVFGILELRRLFKELKPDLICLHSSKAGFIGRLAALKLGIPTVFTAHGWAFSDGVPYMERRIYRLVERMVAALADKIITVSNYDRELAIRNSICSQEKLVLYGMESGTSL